MHCSGRKDGCSTFHTGRAQAPSNTSSWGKTELRPACLSPLHLRLGHSDVVSASVLSTALVQPSLYLIPFAFVFPEKSRKHGCVHQHDIAQSLHPPYKTRRLYAAGFQPLPSRSPRRAYTCSRFRLRPASRSKVVASTDRDMLAYESDDLCLYNTGYSSTLGVEQPYQK